MRDFSPCEVSGPKYFPLVFPSLSSCGLQDDHILLHKPTEALKTLEDLCVGCYMSQAWKRHMSHPLTFCWLELNHTHKGIFNCKGNMEYYKPICLGRRENGWWTFSLCHSQIVWLIGTKCYKNYIYIYKISISAITLAAIMKWRSILKDLPQRCSHNSLATQSLIYLKCTKRIWS